MRPAWKEVKRGRDMDQLVEPSILEVLSSNHTSYGKKRKEKISPLSTLKKKNLVILATSRTPSPCSGPAASLKKFFSASIALLCN